MFFIYSKDRKEKIICNDKQDTKELFSWIKERNDYILKKKKIWILRVLSMVIGITSLTLIVRIIDYIITVLLDTSRSAYKQIDTFSKICESIVIRRNTLYPILNSILMLEYHWTISIEKWKTKAGNDFEKWLSIIGELEALCSIAAIKMFKYIIFIKN